MEGNSTSSVPTCSLQKDGSSPERVSGSTRWFQNCFPGIHSLQSHLERKYGIEKDPLPTEPEQENNGRWRKDNTRASLSMGGGFSPLVEKTGSDEFPGPFQIYHNPNSSLSRGYLLRSLMRMVAMRRMLERILIIQVSNTSNGSSFNLVSTYLQIMSSGCPMYNN